jgi:hypothetical protein
LRTGLAQSKPQLPEQPLALAHPQAHAVTPFQVLGQELPVPQIGRVSELAWGAAKLTRHTLPSAPIERTRTPGTLALPQAFEAPVLEALHPALHGAGILVEELGHRPGAFAFRHQQQPVQSVVVARFLGAGDLLADRHLHDLGIADLELAHRRLPEGIRRDHTRVMRHYLCRRV